MTGGHPPLSRTGLPDWLLPMARVADEVSGEDLTRILPPPEGGRSSAVLVLFGPPATNQPGTRLGDVLLIQRADTLSSHPGQPAFPGGAADPGDDGPVGTALREAVEETGLDPAGVQPFATLPALYLPPSGFVVTPVLAWWSRPSPVGVV
ncbi:MAG TPA: CoA pyrophosphatase, partial [Candidatus Nanopelagicales bacterium]|nr:CoA pyrophosphatase [Candidatus Nanopelagicales bacterium]